MTSYKINIKILAVFELTSKQLPFRGNWTTKISVLAGQS